MCLEVDLGSANRLPLPPTLALKIFDKDEKWQINGPLCFFLPGDLRHEIYDQLKIMIPRLQHTPS